MIMRKFAVILGTLACQEWARPATAQQVSVQRLSARDVPAGVSIAGAFKAARRWTDRNGENLLILTRSADVGDSTLVRSGGEVIWSSEIHGYHFVGRGAGYRLLWQTIDFVRECPYDIFLDYAAGSLQVTDADRDGVAETTYVYNVDCMSDLSPAKMKLILHEGATKYAIRGTQDLRAVSADYPAPAMQVDPSLASRPLLRAFAVAQWQRFVVYSAWTSREAP